MSCQESRAQARGRQLGLMPRAIGQPIVKAAMQGKPAELHAALSAPGAQINDQIVHHCGYEGIDYGVDFGWCFRQQFHGKCQDGNMCRKAGHAECVTDEAIYNHFGSTLCHLVARCKVWPNRVAVLMVLISRGADLSLRNRAGRTAEQLDPVLFAEARRDMAAAKAIANA